MLPPLLMGKKGMPKVTAWFIDFACDLFLKNPSPFNEQVFAELTLRGSVAPFTYWKAD